MSSRTDRVVLAVGVAAVIAWMLSYSWLLGAVIPLGDVRFAVSPWLVAEVAPVVLGGAAVTAGLMARVDGGRMGRRARTGAVLGGVAAGLALLSLAA